MMAGNLYALVVDPEGDPMIVDVYERAQTPGIPDRGFTIGFSVAQPQEGSSPARAVAEAIYELEMASRHDPSTVAPVGDDFIDGPLSVGAEVDTTGVR